MTPNPSANPLNKPAPMPPAKRWWRYGYVWLVISGPALVVVAAIATGWIAFANPDPVLDEDYYRKGLEINKTLANPAASMAPAKEGRNHAQTGVPAPAPAVVKP